MLPQDIDINEALEWIPIGRFQYRLLIMCGFAFMADALEVNLLTYLSVCASSEWNLSDQQQASIASVVFAGIIVGSLFWGFVADRYGRRTTFILVSVIITSGGFLTGAVPSYSWLIVLRSLVGFGIGGANVPFDLLAEFMPSKQRGHFLIYIEYFWTLGAAFVTGLAWLFLNKYGWRTLSILTAIPVAITSLLSIVFLPESPRWLLSMGKRDEAVKVIRKASLVNGHTLPEFTLHKIYEVDVSVNVLNILTAGRLQYVLIPLCVVWMIFGFTYYGVILFIGRLYTDTNSDGSTVCNFDYSSIFINSLAELGGVTISAFSLNIGRTRTQGLFYFLSGLTVLLIGVLHSTSAIFAVSIFARMTIMAASVRIWSLCL
jgi:MFS family permease